MGAHSEIARIAGNYLQEYTAVREWLGDARWEHLVRNAEARERKAENRWQDRLHKAIHAEREAS